MIIEIEVAIGIGDNERIDDESDTIVNEMYEEAINCLELPVISPISYKIGFERVGVARNIHIDRSGMLRATITIREQFKDGLFRIFHSIHGLCCADGCPVFVGVCHPTLANSRNNAVAIASSAEEPA